MAVAMERLPLRKFLIVSLSLFLAVGATLSVALSSEMAVKMVVSAEMDSDSLDGCNDCSGGDDGSMAGCVPACAVNGFAVLNVTSSQKTVQAADLSWPMSLATRGSPPSPDPNPPKPSDFS